MQLPNLDDLRAAQALIRDNLAPTPAYAWPRLAERFGRTVWVKHENVTPITAFKLRGGLVYLARHVAEHGRRGLVSATRGNHGQSLAYAGRRHGVPITIVVPHGNSVEKNAAMRALGAELIEYGDDFQASVEYAQALAVERGLMLVPPFHRDLVTGVATYALELLEALPELARVYVPIGMGSGICGMAAAKVALGHPVEIVGVGAVEAPAYAHAFATGRCDPYPASARLADGMATRQPHPDAVAILRAHVSRVVTVDESEVAAAMRDLFETTHHVAEGAGAAALAGLAQDHHADTLPPPHAAVAVVLSGGNVDRDVFAATLTAD